ncbi:Levanase precursor [compost metagenome]
MTIPRELKLQSINGVLELVQTPVESMKQLRRPILEWSNLDIQPGQNVLSAVHGDKLEIEAEFNISGVEEFGFKVRKSETEETVIGYNVTEQSLFVDRSKSGKTDFNPQFSSRNKAPLAPVNKKIKLRIYVDWSSVEVFANDGQRVITDLIFPDSGSNGLELFAKGGSLRVERLKLYQLTSSQGDKKQ